MSEVYEIIFNRENSYSVFLGIWERKEHTIRNLGQPEIEYNINAFSDICDAIIETKYYACCDKSLLKSNFHLESKRINLKLGSYYPRIYRPIHEAYSNEFYALDWNSDNRSIANKLRKDFELRKKTDNKLPYDKKHLINSVEQLSSLIQMLHRIFRTVHPCSLNFDTFGFEIRNLIILSCTEFESQITGILRENEIESISRNYTTKDYVKLKDILFLKSYSVEFRFYPELPAFSPFHDWSIENPTTSLDWYDYYNMIKHDRESNFEKASLKVLLNSISACFIILIAQYGQNDIIDEVTSRFWKIVKPGMLGLTYEYEYIHPRKNEPWEKINLTI
jgi:hypothetical protein